MSPLSGPFRLPASLVLFIAAQARAALPYNPYQIILASKAGSNGPLYYLLEPPSNTSPAGRLLSLDISSTLTANSSTSNTLSSSLPFLHGDSSLAYTAVPMSDGSLAVYSGSCAKDASKSSLWKYIVDGNDSGSWEKQSFTVQSSSSSTPLLGTEYLSSGFAFSYDTAKSESLYLFGGMCPTANATHTTWISDATYSRQLLILQSQSTSEHTLTSEVAQPAPEAGFTITPLLPTYSNESDGTQTQQQDFVVLGGQTADAFIGMSTIALFSLPQSSWTFVDVDGPAASTDLAAKRQSPQMEPRSGHTAVLTPDGSRIVVFGGWVGDVSSPAEPQLAILEIGAGYGGSSSWSWITTEQSPFDPGDGIYGHGAAMLPGNVMMVTGGYSITTSAAPQQQQESAQTLNNRNLFFNTSSGHWIDDYRPSSIDIPHTSNGNSGGLLNSPQEKAGLGVGLAVGSIVIICVAVFSFFYYRKLKRQRDTRAEELAGNREKDIDDLDSFHQGNTIPSVGHGGVWHGERENRSFSYPSVYGDSSNDIRNAERSGVYVDVPSPQRGLRKSLYGRGHHHSGPRHDEGRGFGSGDMDAIQERDEEGSSAASSRQVSGSQKPPPPSLKLNLDTTNLDPFRDPDPPNEVPMGLHIARPQYQRTISGPKSPSEDEDVGSSGRIRRWAAAGSVSHSATLHNAPITPGRTSPSKSDRTRSDISERSVLSNASASGLLPTRQASSGSVIRGYLPSILPTALMYPFSSTNSSPTYGEAPHSANSFGPSDRSYSFATAKTTISQLQAESEALLGSATSQRLSPKAPNFSLPRGTGTGDLVPDTEPTFSLPRSRTIATRTSPTRSRRTSTVGTWVGSVKRGMGRALGSGRTVSLTSDVGRSFPRIGADGYYDYSADPTIVRPGDSSPKRSDLGGLVDLSIENLESWKGSATSTAAKRERVRRSVSEGGSGASFWATKRGARDWDAGSVEGLADRPSRSFGPDASQASSRARPKSARSEAATTDPHEAADSWGTSRRGSEDWDVEAAVEQRVVQVMFTVPRERLRVVNADVDSLSLASRAEEQAKES